MFFFREINKTKPFTHKFREINIKKCMEMFFFREIIKKTKIYSQKFREIQIQIFLTWSAPRRVLCLILLH